VYLLGSTLYEILTGRPPRQGASREEILEMARTAPPVPPRKLCRDTPRALEAICLKAMSSDKTRRYESALALAEDVQRHTAGEAVAAYLDPLPARVWRWAKRHHQAIGRAAAVIAVVGSVAAAALLYRDASRVRAREQACVDIQEVQRLVDESHFYAANIDPLGEVAPYYDVGHAQKMGRAALAASEKWGPTLDRLPLDDQRVPLRRELSDLCVRLVHIQLARSGGSTATESLSLLDRADGLLSPPSRASHRLRAQTYRLMHRDADAAAAEQALADNAQAPAPSAHDLFLEGEFARLGAATQEGLVLKDAAARRESAKAVARAADLFRHSLRLDPGDYWARLQLARCYVESGRMPEAIEALGACIALRPNAPWAYSTRGLARALVLQFDEAKLDFERALEADPQCVAARLNRAIMQRLANRTADAAAELDSLLALRNPPVEAAIYRGQLFLLVDDPAGALNLLGRFSNKSVCLLRADAHLRLGQIDEARRDLDAVLPPNLAESDSAAMRGHLLRCIAAELPAKHQGTAYELAIVELKRALEKAPAAAAFADLGAVFFEQGRADLAVEPLGRAAALAPNNAQTLINRGWTNVALGRLDAAQSDFAAALRVTPSHAEALSGLGYVAARKGSAREAQLEASLALIKGSDDYRILHNVACIYAQLSVTDAGQAAMHEQAAVGFLGQAVDRWRRGWRGPHELDLIRKEVAFPASMRERADFQKLIAEPGGGAGGGLKT
jgi:tetratricopeptide (TPR) repeat protein